MPRTTVAPMRSLREEGEGSAVGEASPLARVTVAAHERHVSQNFLITYR
jgi:hypothetical protein